MFSKVEVKYFVTVCKRGLNIDTDKDRGKWWEGGTRRKKSARSRQRGLLLQRPGVNKTLCFAGSAGSGA